MSDKYLIVEGYYDFIFYTSLFAFFSIKGIKVIQPKEFGRSYNGKGNAISLLKDLIKQLYDGRVARIGIIIDADFTSISNQGFNNTITQIHDRIKEDGYDIYTQACNYKAGIIFRSSKGLPDIAVWVMPDNCCDGYLESFLLQLIHQSHMSCLHESESVCSGFKNCRFPDHHNAKAILAVFMAMQENPGRNITHLIEKQYIDCNHMKIKQLTDFISSYYR